MHRPPPWYSQALTILRQASVPALWILTSSWIMLDIHTSDHFLEQTLLNHPLCVESIFFLPSSTVGMLFMPGCRAFKGMAGNWDPTSKHKLLVGVLPLLSMDGRLARSEWINALRTWFSFVSWWMDGWRGLRGLIDIGYLGFVFFMLEELGWLFLHKYEMWKSWKELSQWNLTASSQVKPFLYSLVIQTGLCYICLSIYLSRTNPCSETLPFSKTT